MSTPITEAHLRLANQLVASPPSPLVLATLIADSEAEAVQTAMLREYGNLCATNESLAKERDQLRAEVERLKDGGVQRIKDAMATVKDERDQLRVEVERLKKQIKDDNRSYGCELRDPNGTIWEQATKDRARAERAELEVERLKRDYEYDHKCLCEVRDRCELWKQRAEHAEADLDQVACARTDGILRESDLQCRLNMERARLKKIETALKDAISTYFGDDKLVTAERIEAWQAALKEDAK